jgi:serine phosphatase RsbU (regulator of sigma subunit)
MRAVINALLEIAQSLRKTLALDEVFPQVLDSLFKIFPGAEQGFIVFRREDGALEAQCVKVREPGSGQQVRVSTTIVNRVMDSQQAILSADAAGDFRFKASESLVRAPIRSVMCAPLIDSEGSTFGAIQIDTLDYRGRFQEDDLHVFVAVATQASIAVDNAHLHEMTLRQRDMERDLELADQIQRSFLPTSPPQVTGYRFYDYYYPASYVGADYYQYIPLPDGRLAIVVADVVGHGLAAAMLTAKLAAEVRYQLLTEGRPAEAIARLNASLSATLAENHFVTLVVVALDPTSGQLEVVNAGHPPPLICPPGGQAAEIGIHGSGFPLGVEKDAAYEPCSIQLPRRGLVAVYTDGIREAINAEREIYGLTRLGQRLQAASGDLQQIGQGIVDDVRQFIANNPQADDMCLVCFRRE